MHHTKGVKSGTSSSLADTRIKGVVLEGRLSEQEVAGSNLAPAHHIKVVLAALADARIKGVVPGR